MKCQLVKESCYSLQTSWSTNLDQLKVERFPCVFMVILRYIGQFRWDFVILAPHACLSLVIRGEVEVSSSAG